MHFSEHERTALFIDGANLYSACKELNLAIDYKLLLEFFQTQCNLIRALYYTAILEDQDYAPIRPLVDWLDYNGYTMITKPAKVFNGESGQRKIKGNMDIEIAVGVMELAPNIDHVVLASGDGDFRPLVEAVQWRGKKVSVLSTLQTKPPMVADELRRQADHFIDLHDLADDIGRTAGGKGGRDEVFAKADDVYREYLDD